jgi:hypothetical protein
VAVDAGRNVLLTGSFEDSVSFGGSQLTSAGARDGVVARYTPAGAHFFSVRFGGQLTDEGRDVVASIGAEVVAAGYTTDSTGHAHLRLAKYSGGGTQQWSRTTGGTGTSQGLALVVDANRDVIVSGIFSDDADFGNVVLNAAGFDVFLAEYTADGDPRWARGFGNTGGTMGTVWPFDLALDPNDDIVMTGSFQFNTDFDGGPLSSAGDNDVFLARYANFGGTHLSSVRFGGRGNDQGLAVAVGPDHQVYVGGAFSGTADFLNGSLASAGFQDAFLLRWKP